MLIYNKEISVCPITTHLPLKLIPKRINKDLKAGDVLRKSDLICKRPGSGISPIDIDKIIGCKIKKSLKNDEILRWEYIDVKVS